MPAIVPQVATARNDPDQVLANCPDHAGLAVNCDVRYHNHERVAAVLHQYRDQNIDFADAAIVAIAERLKVQRILTLDRRHFNLLRPHHCTAFEILPS